VRYVLFVICSALLWTSAAADRQTKPNSATFSKTIELKTEQHTNACEASALLEYFQRGAEAEVETTIENSGCTASSGEFTIETTVRADGQTDSDKLSFPETWSRDNNESVVITKRYPIGDDVDLLRVKVRKLRCECSEEATEPDVASKALSEEDTQ
jgi:hypothetical protein